MEIVMTRTAEGRSTTRVRRDDGVTLELPSYAPLHRLPHDLAHFVVERTLGLPWGFWGSIAAGVVFGGVEVLPRKAVFAGRFMGLRCHGSVSVGRLITNLRRSVQSGQTCTAHFSRW